MEPDRTIPSKRVPLASNPQAINSPLRHPNGGAKRSRDQITETRHHEEQPPQKKRQLLDSTHPGLQRTKAIPVDNRDARIFDPRTSHGSISDFQRKLAGSAVSKNSHGRELDKVPDRELERPTHERELERAKPERQPERVKHKREPERVKITDKQQVKTWQRHYRRAFPTFVFYFESLPEGARAASLKSITNLGAREETFFSKAVTHIVTTRMIPSESDSSSQMRSSSSKNAQSQSQHNTINPSLLDKPSIETQYKPTQHKARGVDLLPQNRPQAPVTNTGNRQQQSLNADILVKARDMGIKLWPLEKFDRMLRTLLDVEANDQELSLAPARRGGGRTQVKPQPADTDLQQLLKDEKSKQTGQLPWSDVVPLRGFYIYVHDAEEKNRPVMVREYEKPRNYEEEGDWPQLRSVSMPRCPFMIEASSKHDETEQQEPAGKAARPIEPPTTQVKHTESAASQSRMASVEPAKPTYHTQQQQQHQHQKPIFTQPMPPQARYFEPPQAKEATSNTTDSLPAHLTNRFHFNGLMRPDTSREPLASGLQRSNQTSAIRSQVISSTAANPVARAGGRSKEMQELQRRAVEQQRRSGLSTASVPSNNDVRAAINNDPSSMAGRGSRTRHQHDLPKIYEDETQSDEDEDYSSQQQLLQHARHQQHAQHQQQSQDQPQKHQHCRTQSTSSQTTKKRKKKAAQKEPKPGYCENCRDKYDEFQEHIVSRKHRKFAMSNENWVHLDALLAKLKRK